MADKIKLNYPQMEEMAKHLKSVQQRLDQTNRLARTVAQEMQGGALVGDAGEAFVNALNSAFMPAVTKLGQKFGEVSDDIKKAISDMKSADSSSAREF
jgi:WXG100 family type VII secretion target